MPRADVQVGSYEDMHGSANAFKSEAGAMDARLLELRKRIEGKLAEMDGETKEAYFVTQAEYDRARQDQSVVLNQLGAAVHKVADLTYDGDHKGAQLFGHA